MLVGFDPIIAKQPRIIILGSMPSVTSLQQQEYYGFAHNRFWKFMGRIYAMPITTYAQKQQIILKNHMILWDVIHSCEREGSLDSKIKNETVNDIAGLVKQYPGLVYVVCNGRKSYDLYQKHFAQLALSCTYLPSTSNANRSISEETLYQLWETQLKSLET